MIVSYSVSSVYFQNINIPHQSEQIIIKTEMYPGFQVTGVPPSESVVVSVPISGIAAHLRPRPAGHTHPPLAALGKEPPTVQIFHNSSVTQNLSIPDTL